jgi:hypothetical protein
MINIYREEDYLHIIVVGEFNLADYQEFEKNVLYQATFQARSNILFDLSEMLHYTIDVAIEELRFIRKHPHSFGRIAVVSNDQIVNWHAWLSALLLDADIHTFDNVEDARRWMVGEPDVALGLPK